MVFILKFQAKNVVFFHKSSATRWCSFTYMMQQDGKFKKFMQQDGVLLQISCNKMVSSQILCNKMVFFHKSCATKWCSFTNFVQQDGILSQNYLMQQNDVPSLDAVAWLLFLQHCLVAFQVAQLGFHII